MLAGGAAGLLFAFGLQGSCSGPQAGSQAPDPTGAPASQPTVVADAASLARLHAWCDEAQTLTPTEVWLDERAQERWLFRRPELEAIRDDGLAPAKARSAAREALSALNGLGL